MFVFRVLPGLSLSLFFAIAMSHRRLVFELSVRLFSNTHSRKKNSLGKSTSENFRARNNAAQF